MASLTLQGIGKRYGKTRILSGVDIHVEDGEFCVLLGPSGCGKSTLLHIIAGLILQDEGSVLLDGRPVDGLTPGERDVAMVFQNYALYPHMTVWENLSFGLRMRKVPGPEIKKRVRETSRLLGIESLLDRKPKQLSGGQQQRVAMGRALVRRPKAFILDEPLSNLDARLRADVRVELKSLHRRVGGTVLYVTHDQVEAMTLGDRVVVMNRGEVRQTGSPDDVYSRPADTFVAAFVGSPRMNLFQGRIVRTEGGPRFEGDGFSLDLHGWGDFGPEGEAEIGIRPEDVKIAPPGRGGPVAEVLLASDVGPDTHVHARLGREDLVVRIPGRTDVKPGGKVALESPAERVHLFRGGLRVPTGA